MTGDHGHRSASLVARVLTIIDVTERATRDWVAVPRARMNGKTSALMTLARCEADRRTVHRHLPTWPGGEPEYGRHWERTESGDWADMPDRKPVDPYWCDTCSVAWPCPEILDRAAAWDVQP